MLITTQQTRLRLYLLVGLLTSLFSLVPHQAKAQGVKALPNDIFEALSAEGKNEGRIIIHQPAHIRALIGKTSKRALIGLDSGEAIALSTGYRIQAYNGNLPTSKQEAYRRAEKIHQMLNNTPCYITYKAPFWRLLVGDFETIEDARVALGELKTSLPHIASELYIVRDNIR